MSRSGLLLCVLAAVCGAEHPSRLREPTPEADPHGCIVGGEPVDIWQFPWQVSLEGYTHGWFVHFCGGSIISSTWVLTGAHCTRFTWAKTVYVRAGSSFHGKGGNVYRAVTIIEHEDYNAVPHDYDIALLELSEPIAFGSNVQAVNLGNSEIVSGTKVNVTGWGDTSEGGLKPEQLHAITKTVIDRETCKAAYELFYNITERMVCAAAEEGGKAACSSDSGGPLVVGSTQYGVVSFGRGCARPEFPGVYSNVPALRGWITEKTGV